MKRRSFLARLMGALAIPLILPELEDVKAESIPNTAIVDKITYLGEDDYTIEYSDTSPWNYVDEHWHHFVYVRKDGEIITYVDGERYING